MHACDYEQRVMEALAKGYLPVELRDHVDLCDFCSESALVWEYLDGLQPEDAHDSALPAAGLIWWRAQLAQKRRLAERSVAGIDIVQRIAFGVLLLLLLMLIFFGRASFELPLVASGLLVLLTLAAGVLYAWAHERI